LVCGKEEDRWLSEDNQRDDNEATCQKSQPESPVIYESWYEGFSR